jgi:glycosyltransferase involved in cell wall biosynthesis
LVGPRTGVGIWTEKVAEGLAGAEFGTVFLAASKALNLGPDDGHAALQVVAPPSLPLLGPVWLNTVVPGLLRRLNADLWIGSLAVLPVRCPVPAVAMVHDLTPRTHPRRHTLRNRLVFRCFFERSMRTAHTVVVGSGATEDVLSKAFPWADDKVVKIGYGVDEWYSPPAEGDRGVGIRERYSGGRPYLLHLGTVEPRKGIPDLVAAWERLLDDDANTPDLVIAGRLGWGTSPIVERIRSSRHASRIHLPGYVGRGDARELLRHAEAFALASEAEGFGLPLAEAVSCGTPAVATDIPALREAGGDAAVFCPVRDPEALAAGLREALRPDAAARLRERAKARAPKLRWGPVIDAWKNLVRRIVNESRS